MENAITEGEIAGGELGMQVASGVRKGRTRNCAGG